VSDVLTEPTRFADALRRPDTRGREVETALAMHIEPFFYQNRLTAADMIRALMGNAVAIVLAKSTGFDDALDGVQLVADETVRRVREASRR
jgi:hypothetical protein